MPRSTDDKPVEPAYFQKQAAIGVSEKELQEWVMQEARMRGWSVRHIRDSRGQDVAGLPDLLLWKGQVSFWIELKAERGKLSKDRVTQRGVFVEGQEETFLGLRRAGHAIHLFKPSDWQSGKIARVLGIES